MFGHPEQTTYITGPIIIRARSFGKPLLRASGELFHQRDQIEKKLNIESPRRHTECLVGGGRGAVSPFLGYGEAAALTTA